MALNIYSKWLLLQYEYSVLSNIYAGGLPPIEAGSVIAEKVSEILKFRAAGNRLENLLQSMLQPTTA